jgi:hypothetical protein
VRAWREKYREYGRKEPLTAEPLQEMIMGQPVDELKKSDGLALQEMIQPEVRESVEEIGV